MWILLMSVLGTCDGLDLFEGAQYFASEDGPQFFWRSRNGCVWQREPAAENLLMAGPWMWSLVDRLPKQCLTVTRQDATRPPSRMRTIRRKAWLRMGQGLGSRRWGSRKKRITMDSELENFKSNIDLRSYAAGQGYELDRKESWRGTSVMRHPLNHDKIVIKRGLDGHYVYFSVRDDRDNGSIIDFVQFRQKVSIGAVRKELRPWIGQPPVSVPAYHPLHKTEKDRVKVEAAWARMQDLAGGHPYLENERALPGSLLTNERFTGRVRIDAKGNAVFPHFDGDGLSGYELKNVGFTGFASGGSKGLWLSHELADDKRLVFSESAIDALSHAVLFPDGHARFASIGGKPNPQQSELIRAAAARMPLESEIISAMDADKDGAELTDVVRKAVALTGRLDLRFSVHEPFGAKDFNDVLRSKPKSTLPSRVQEPFVA
jgi:hypothetical protein